MRLLLPMAYTIAFVMESATYANGKPSNPDKNYTYRLLELDVEPDSQAHTQPANNDYTDNSYQQSIIPRRTHSAYAAAAGSNNKEGDDQDQNDDKAARITTTKLKNSNNRRPMRNGNQWSSEKVEIPDDFQREISQLRIPRRVNKKKKLKSASKKRRQQKANADSDMGADMDLDMDMDVNVDMDLDVGEEIKLGTDDIDTDKDGDNNGGEHKNKNRNTGQKYSKGRKQRRRKKPKAKAKENHNYDSNTSSSSSNASGDEDDSNRNSENGDGGGGGEDDDENNHQEEEEEVEEKKEKVHKVTIKKKRPYVNSTKSTAGGATSAATKQNGTPILHSHSHDFSKLPYQNLIGIPNQNKKGNIKANTQNVNSGSSSGGGVNMVSANAAAAAALKALQKHKNNGGTRQPHQTKPVRPLISQENSAIALNPNHQENTGSSNAVDSSAIRKGIKPRDVNLILRTKNSPRILIRRYKPLFGVYPVGVGLNSLGQRKLLGVGVYHRPHKTRKKACKRCKKRRGKHKFYGNTYPALASDVNTLQPYSQSLSSANQVTPTPCAPHMNAQNYLNGAFSDAFSASPSPLQTTSAFGGGSGAAHPWYAIRGGQSSPFGSSDDDDHGSGSSNTFSPYNFSPNRFEYVDENVISPRLPSQPVNTYLRMPLASFGEGGAIRGDGSARSNDNGNSNIKDNSKGSDDVYETLPLLFSTEAPVQVDSSNQAMAAVTPKEQEENDDQGDNEGQAAIEEDDQQQQRWKRRKKPQRGKKTTAESSPVYEVHETEYEPVTGHENVEDLAAVHQLETDASLFPDEQGDHPSHSRRSQDVENDASSADQYNQQLTEPEPEPEEKEDEKEDEEFQEYDYFDNEAQKQPANEQPDDEGEVDQGDDQEEQQQQDYVDGDGNAEGDSAIENEIENENAQSAKLFDIPNADQWSYEMSESDS